MFNRDLDGSDAAPGVTFAPDTAGALSTNGGVDRGKGLGPHRAANTAAPGQRSDVDSVVFNRDLDGSDAAPGVTFAPDTAGVRSTSAPLARPKRATHEPPRSPRLSPRRSQAGSFSPRRSQAGSSSPRGRSAGNATAGKSHHSSTSPSSTVTPGQSKVAQDRFFRGSGATVVGGDLSIAVPTQATLSRAHAAQSKAAQDRFFRGSGATVVGDSIGQDPAVVGCGSPAVSLSRAHAARSKAAQDRFFSGSGAANATGFVTSRFSDHFTHPLHRTDPSSDPFRWTLSANPFNSGDKRLPHHLA